MGSFYENMRAGAAKNLSNDAVVFYGTRIKFERIVNLVDRAACGLAAFGVGKGSVVTLCVPNSPSAMIAFYALSRLGAIPNLVHPLSAAVELERSVTASGSMLLIAYDMFLSEKGAELNVDVPIIKTRSDYFMGLIPKIVFGLKSKKAAKRAKKARAENDKACADTSSNANASCASAASSAGAANAKASTKPVNYAVFESLFSSPPPTEPPAEYSPDSPAVYLPSGGTSGSPKIIMHTAEVFNQLCSHAAFFLSEPLERYSAMYSVLPIFHGFGLCMNLHMCATLGLKNVMSLRFSPKSMIKAIKKERVNVITGVPAMYQKLLACPDFARADLSSVKDCFVGGDSAPKQLVEDFNLALRRGGSMGGLYVGYGLTETVTVCAVTCKRHDRLGSIGYPLPDVKFKIVAQQEDDENGENGGNNQQNPLNSSVLVGKDNLNSGYSGNNSDNNCGGDGELKELAAGEIGEICISTPLLMLGYLDSDFSPIRQVGNEKWLMTGDLGYVDADGFLYFKQRIKNMIKVSGVPVFPSEIEDVVCEVSGVVRAAVIAVSDKNTGQAAKLFVESKTSDPKGLTQQILTKCKKQLNPYSVPKYIEIRSSLPLSAVGKVDRKKLQ